MELRRNVSTNAEQLCFARVSKDALRIHLISLVACVGFVCGSERARARARVRACMRGGERWPRQGCQSYLRSFRIIWIYIISLFGKILQHMFSDMMNLKVLRSTAASQLSGGTANPIQEAAEGGGCALSRSVPQRQWHEVSAQSMVPTESALPAGARPMRSLEAVAASTTAKANAKRKSCVPKKAASKKQS